MMEDFSYQFHICTLFLDAYLGSIMLDVTASFERWISIRKTVASVLRFHTRKKETVGKQKLALINPWTRESMHSIDKKATLCLLSFGLIDRAMLITIYVL